METEKLDVEAVLLDLDGTLVDSREAYLDAVKTAFLAFNVKTFDVTLVKEIPRRLEQKLPLDDLLQGLDVKKFLDTYLKAYYRVTATKTKPIHGAAAALEVLSSKAKLALITMRHVPKKAVLEELESMGLLKFCDFVVTALDTENAKPSPEAILKCAERFDVERCKCAVVGDSVSDIKAGKAAGAKTVGVLSGLFSREELEKEKPDLILESVCELPLFVV